MKIRRVLLIAVAGIAAVVVVALAASAFWGRKPTPFQNGPKLISALQAFSRDQASAGRQLPPEVPLQDLIRSGYLATNDLAGLQGMDVTFSMQAGDANPQSILARARAPDGQVICLLADGSAQQLSLSKYEELRANLGQAGGAASGGPRVGGETNSMSLPEGTSR